MQQGTTGQSWADQNLAPRGVTLKTVNLSTDMFAELAAGAVTGVVNDEPASRAAGSSLAHLRYFPGVPVPPQFAGRP